MLTTDQLLGKGRYRIISNFTQDVRGGLYEAYDTVSNTNVVLRETVGSTGGVMTPTQLDAINSAFAGEAKALREVRHESLLSVQDYFSEIDRHYLVMESVDGSDLTRFLQPEEKMPALGDFLKWADQILDALHYLHTLPTPLVHRDIRPANIRLTSNFKVKLLTAGIDASDVIMASAGNLADASVLNYRPLEQLWGGLDPASQKVITNHYDDRSRRILQQPLDARSDIYAVGATLYHVMTRTLPKDALERSIDLLDGNSDPLIPPAELESSIPEDISELIMKAMEIRREHRYDSAAIMRQVLEGARQKLQAKKTAEPKPRPAPEPVSEPEKTTPSEKVAELELPQKAAVLALAEQAAEKVAAEQKRAEQRQREIEADLERQRKEAERIKAATEQEAAKKAKVEETTDEQFLLEVEPVVPANDNFEWSVDISEQPSSTPATSHGVMQANDDFDFNIAPAPRSNIKVMVAGAAGLVVVIAIVSWLFIGGSAPVEPPKAQVPAVQQNVPEQQEVPPVSTYSDPNAGQLTNQAADQTTQLNQTVPAESNSQPTATQSKQKKAAPTPAKTAEKKKVTVDDLINDN